MASRLFVYGTLAPGRDNHEQLSGLNGIWQSASVRGDLYASGWGAALGYPALILNAAGPRVEGFLFSCKELDQHWPRLDEFEGDGYERVLTPVKIVGGEVLEAYVYQLAPALHPDAPIGS